MHVPSARETSRSVRIEMTSNGIARRKTPSCPKPLGAQERVRSHAGFATFAHFCTHGSRRSHRPGQGTSEGQASYLGY
eukprot:2233888-Pleurochrysis_carterae.AAC.1